MPVPVGAKVILTSDRAEYWLGENVFVHFVLENTGSEPFEFDAGGDYRGAPRALRFKVTAKDEDRHAAEDPFPPGTFWFGGGLGGGGTLKPGEKWTHSVPIMRYCDIDHAGRWTFRITHDLGWKEDERKRPVGEIVLTFKMPGDAQAEKVVQEMEAMPRHSWPRHPLRNLPDYTCLRLPVYLGPVLHRIEQGKVEMLDALALIPTRGATAALIRVAAREELRVAVPAGETLCRRIPYGWMRPSAARQRLVERAWDEKFVPEVCALAAQYLATKEPEKVKLAGRFLEAVGTLEHVPSVLSALDGVVEGSLTPRRSAQDKLHDMSSPLRELAAAMTALRDRGL